jgi:UDP-N-acetylglucosamine 2-epimerase
VNVFVDTSAFTALAHVVRQHVGLVRRRSSFVRESGLQPEAYALATIHRAKNTEEPQRLSGVPYALGHVAERSLPALLPLRPRTRKALDATGRNALAGADRGRIEAAARRLLDEPSPPPSLSAYGDSHVTERIVTVLVRT